MNKRKTTDQEWNKIDSLRKLRSSALFSYHLIDNGGFNIIEMKILLPVGAVFEHEFGTYEVFQITNGGRNEYPYNISCNRISSSTPTLDMLLGIDQY